MLVRIKKFHILLLWAFLLFSVTGGESLSAESGKYSVVKGDTLYAIAKKFNVPLQVLIDFNKLKKNASLIPGTELRIPDLYTVQKGDTLYGIARKFNITLDELLAVSGRSEKQPLKAGETIYIPAGAFPSGDKTATGKAVGPSPAPVAETTPPAGRSDGRKETLVAAPAARTGVSEWPLSGERSFQDGKLPRIVIRGKEGEPVFNIVPGQIIWVGTWGIFGPTVIVQSDSGYLYIYAGSDSVKVKVGDRIEKGRELGTLGLMPGEKEPVLNFFVYKDGKPIHPANAPRN